MSYRGTRACTCRVRVIDHDCENEWRRGEKQHPKNAGTAAVLRQVNPEETRRHCIARVVLHAFPQAVRSARGQEMLGTLLDASASSRTRFAREIIDLIRSGLRTRATHATEAGARRLTSDDTTAAVVLLALIFLVPPAFALLRTNPRPAIARTEVGSVARNRATPGICFRRGR